ncbi:aspartate-semialdehyde dehydrogenase [Pyrolobus fumarii 1A]|uniref:Aspartate-semialdehyde dehydrogenase n=1 Tax=Pyrolobus fumarii (strain DSM 11204 / 1A) TaxID=694429 RepID=G0EDX5_PYRF1|nr:aspartate-semialdehyde dehydrogenase [Pyrolobus fumarii]AEM38744.1 aspartate-semialdehyde dehydrogenase [Pyrolobus fumarii 1A]
MPDKLRAAVLGATGLVGQMFVKLLDEHPMFEIVYVAASERSAGRSYCEAVNWVLGGSPPESLCGIKVEKVGVDNVPKSEVDVVFSALPSSVAGEIEAGLARRGFTVVSNASPMRLEEDVPLLVPEINWDHVGLVKIQRQRRGWSGAIYKNPNCSSAILVLSLKPLLDNFGLEKVLVTTMQAVSGAGYNGVPSMAILDNIVPFIAKEEEKLANEPRKILGVYRGDRVEWARFTIHATTTRVPVLHGHLESVYAYLSKPASVEDVVQAWESWRPWGSEKPFMAPEKPVVYRREVDRPQPRLDRMEGGGMSSVTGRARMVEDRLLAYLVLGHNLIRGAAGNAILIAEMLAREGMI